MLVVTEDFDWEEQHEKLSEVIEVGDRVLYGRPSRESDVKNYTSQEVTNVSYLY
jgi:hypothetical protein